MFISRCCGQFLVGYYQGENEDYVFISDEVSGGRTEKIGKNAIVEITQSDTDVTCIDI